MAAPSVAHSVVSRGHPLPVREAAASSNQQIREKTYRNGWKGHQEFRIWKQHDQVRIRAFSSAVGAPKILDCRTADAKIGLPCCSLFSVVIWTLLLSYLQDRVPGQQLLRLHYGR